MVQPGTAASPKGEGSQQLLGGFRVYTHMNIIHTHAIVGIQGCDLATGADGEPAECSTYVKQLLQQLLSKANCKAGSVLSPLVQG